MQTHPFRFGGLAAISGIAAWVLEWHLGVLALSAVVVVAKLIGFIALVFCVQKLGPLLFGSWRAGSALWLTLSASSILSLFACLPFRVWMPQWANDGMRRWYYEGMPRPEGDYQQWLTAWQGFVPHLFEASVLMVFFAILVAPCVLFRIRMQSAVLVCLLGYALLAVAPIWSGLLAFDYDTFHLGIAVDSIALSIWPMGLGYSDAHTIFALGFLAVFFTASRLFLLFPIARSNTPAGSM